ncbi:FxSxx-COOH system tetratricopeptide repeat protein [Actinoplanes sp. NPDC049599]|uniref:FxSxx-COOH system tetratricopeptide repeat protein n=1 Tax=Actinoplanes sp. NPDC049599 TaxID=3363903 RepID=UPI0037B67C31
MKTSDNPASQPVLPIGTEILSIESSTGLAIPDGIDVRDISAGQGVAITAAEPAGIPPRAWNVAARNPDFVGRKQLLQILRRRLLGSKSVVVQALHGMGGVGKTQLAIEYCHRYSDYYDIVWFFAAERTDILGDQYADLAVEAGLASRDIDTASAVRIVRAHFRSSDRWLVIFDNAEDPASLRAWLPSGRGHTMITSRNESWREVAAPLSVNVFNRFDSVALLVARLPNLSPAAAGRLAHEMGDLPLALAQAAGVMAETGISESEYRTMLTASPTQLLDHGKSAAYPRSLVGTVRIAVDRLRAEDAASPQLLGLCSYFAPERIPFSVFSEYPGNLPEPLATTAKDMFNLRRSAQTARRLGLARIDNDFLQLHRLTRGILIASADALVSGARILAEDIIVQAAPEDADSPLSWSKWGVLFPHILAQDPASSANEEIRGTTVRMVWYLICRGDVDAARILAEELRETWLRLHGPMDPNAIVVGNHLARSYAKLGMSTRARELQESVLRELRSVYGDDDVRTLAAAGNLGGDLRRSGAHAAALKIDQDVLMRRRRVLGEDHPDTLRISNGVARDLRRLGAIEEARKIDENVYKRMRQLMGDDHVYTLASANSLAYARRTAGDLIGARALDENTFRRCREVLGENHPATLVSAFNLARDLFALGNREEAQKLDEETLSLRRNVLGRTHPDTINTARFLVADLRALGKDEAAGRLEEEILSVRQVVGDPSEPDGNF